MEVLTHPLEPIVFEDSRVLILGSFPSIKSFEVNFYYGHPQNRFWKILSTIYGMEVETEAQKIALAKTAKIAIWDIVKSCTRENSLDSSLKIKELNDIEALLKKHPNITKVACTGRLSHTLFLKHFGHLDIETLYLTSPSPANARIRFEEKMALYREVLLDQ